MSKRDKRKKNEAAFQKVLLVSQLWKCVSLLQSIYTKIRSMILPSPKHPANRDMSASVGALEFTVNLAERTSVKGSDRTKSRKPGNVKSQKSAEALKSESPPAEASLSSHPTQGTTIKLTEHLSTHSHHSIVNGSH